MSKPRFPTKKSLRSEKQAWAIVVKWRPWIMHYSSVHYHKCINRYSETVFSQEWDDFLQTAFLGSYRAAQLFDESKGFCFPTYASHWIDRFAIKNFLSKRFYHGKLLRFNEQIDQNDIGEDEHSILESINQSDISKVLHKTISASSLLTDLYVNDKSYFKIGQEVGVTREAIRQRRNKEINKIRLREDKCVL